MSAQHPDAWSGVAVPVAMGSDGRLVRPVDAERGVAYSCPGCGAAVRLRRGDRTRAHFAHRRGEGCAPESVLHRAAKACVLQVITDWKATAGPRPAIARSCPEHGCDGGVTQDLPDDVTRAEAEVRLAGNVIGDVVLYRGDTPAAVVEVLVSSRVGREKVRRMPLPWIEVRAEDVLDRPYWWVAVQDGLQPFACARCAELGRDAAALLRGVRERAATAAAATGSPTPTPPYRAAAHRCWRCATDTVVYAWPGCGSRRARRPPEPVPGTVRRVTTNAAGDHWANCCHACAAVQSDYHLRRDNPDYARVREAANDPTWIEPPD